MSFIRAKEIPPRSGNWYDYEVKTVHEGNKVRQKVIRYIGPSVRTSAKVSTGHSRAINPYPVELDTPIVYTARIPKGKEV
jgi:predicted RNase H-related nuclease YkuK (DUF458 family)